VPKQKTTTNTHIWPGLSDLPVDRSIPQTELNIENKVRSNLFPWNAQFSPQLISSILSTYATAGHFVLDPFMGSGTVLVEAARLGLRAFGADVNPAPVKIASIYSFTNRSAQKRRELLESVESLLHAELPDALPLLAADFVLDEAQLKAKLAHLATDARGTPTGVLLDALIVLLDFDKPNLCVGRVFDAWQRLADRVATLPYSRTKIEAQNCDARALPLPDTSIDLVITSPPYINVFNYHQKYRKSVESLGWHILEVAKSEIGSNRKHRGNRFLTVTQYCLDITDCLFELARVAKDGARMIWTVGRESNVRKTPFYNGDILVRLASCCPYVLPECRQERVFQNRFGIEIYEDIIHLRVHKSPSQTDSVDPRIIAHDLLCQARSQAPSESRTDLNVAIAQVQDVQGSPQYDPQRANPLATEIQV
jgi:hypothetical protein